MIRAHAGATTAFAEEIGHEGAVAVEGNRTNWDRGGPLALGSRCVRAPSGILAHAPEDMTVRVLCGTDIAELHDELRNARQRTALPELGGTVGGAIAVGDDDLGAPGLGRVRDAVLQCTTVTAAGGLLVGGGPTVKNVSGYDIPRLMVGALGTLGPLAEVLLRTTPTPAASAWWRADEADSGAIMDSLYRPTALCTDGTATWVHLRGHPADIAAQAQLLGRHGSFETVAAGPTLPRWRWSLPRREVRQWVADRVGDGLACLLTGRLWRTVPQPPGPIDPVIAELNERIRSGFDPGGRFNPGRDVLRR